MKHIDSLEELPETRYVGELPDSGLQRRFAEVIKDTGLGNVFNPSFYESSRVNVYAFRAIPHGSHKLESYVSVETPSGRTLSRISPELYPALNVPRLIDPRVFTIGEDIYLTFNSGWLPSGRNDIFVMQIYPTIERPKKVEFEGRQDMERNWAFFTEGGEVYAIYRISPLIILRLEQVSESAWFMVELFRNDDQSEFHDLTLGTQPVRYADRHYFMAHRKYLFRQKKLYLGRLCALDTAERAVTLADTWMAHSPQSLLGNAVKHNSNLFSCTYFSGLQASSSGLSLGYGINDVDFGFSTLDLEALEQRPRGQSVGMTAHKAPEITILLLNYRRPANIPVILDSIRRQTVKPVVFLWNNGPDDVNLTGIDRYEVAGENQGCMARWKMALHATTPWIMSLDDDLCFARDDALETILQTLRTLDDPARIIGPAGCNFHNNPKYSQRRDVYAGYASEPFSEPVDLPVRHDQAVDMIKGRSMALRRDQLEDLVFPDEREDDIFLSAALAAGRGKFHRVPTCLNSAFRELPELGVGNWFEPEHLNSRNRAIARYFFPESSQPLQAKADGSWRPRSLGIIRERRDGQLLVQLADGSGVELNSTASLIWALCDGHRTEAELLAELSGEFNVPENILRPALRGALNELLNIGALGPEGRDSE
jgi:hypothetical protein